MEQNGPDKAFGGGGFGVRGRALSSGFMYFVLLFTLYCRQLELLTTVFSINFCCQYIPRYVLIYLSKDFMLFAIIVATPLDALIF